MFVEMLYEHEKDVEEDASAEPTNVDQQMTTSSESGGDDDDKSKAKVNMVSLVYNAGTAVLTGIAIIMLWALPQKQNDHDEGAGGTAKQSPPAGGKLISDSLSTVGNNQPLNGQKERHPT